MRGPGGRVRAGAFLLCLLLPACASSTLQHAQPARLNGAWSRGGPSFDFVIEDHTILFEFDMREHPYTLDGDVVVIDFLDPMLGVQRKRILRLTADELEWQDEATGIRGSYRRMPGSC